MNYQEKLINKVISGDEKAFEELYKSTYKKVHFTCRAFLKNENDVADIEQEIYITVLNSLDTLQDKTKFESWLGRITVNKCRDYLKKKSPVLVEDEILAEVLEEDDELKLPEEYVSNKAKRKILMEIIRECLSDTLYQTVILFYFNDMSAAEIAELMECPVGTITSRLCLARAKIKEGILAYEKKSGDKLHGIALVPVLGLLFKEEAMAMEPAIICNKVIKTSSTKLNTVRLAETGGKIMLKSMKMKLAIGILAVVVVGGGIVATVAVKNGKDSNEVNSNVEEVMDDDEKNDSTNTSDEDFLTNNQGNSSANSDNSTNSQEESKVDVTEVGTALIDNERVKIIYSGSEWWEERGWYKVYFTVTNKLDEQLSINVNRNFAINGFHNDPNLYEIIEPNETIECTLNARDYYLKEAGIEHIDFLDMIFAIYPEESGGMTEERVRIVPEESRGVNLQTYQIAETDEVLLDTDEVLLVAKGYEIKDGDLWIYYYIQNRTDKDICFTTKSAKINGEYQYLEVGSPFIFADGYGHHDDFRWWDKDFSEVDLDTVEFDLVLYTEEFEYDPEIGARKELFRQSVTISDIFNND